MTKQVQLSNAAYQRLKSLKGPGESFSDLVQRLADTKKDPRLFVGRNATIGTMREALAEARRVKGPRL